MKRGIIEIQIKGKDKTPPNLQWVNISGDNVIRAHVYDGGKIRDVQAILTSKDSPEIILKFKLSDDGDHVFSKKIPDQLFGLYHVEVIAEDDYGNKMAEKVPGDFVLH